MEALYLACGVRRPQLMRVSLGGARVSRSHWLVPWLLAVACNTGAHTITGICPYPSPTVPHPPLTVADTLTRLALDSTAAVLLGSQHEPFVISSSGPLTPHSLPTSERARFLVVPSTDIQRFADDHGDLGYLEARVVWVTTDTAIVTITQTAVFRRPDHRGPVVHDGGFISEWLATRRAGQWIVRRRNYVVLD